VELESVDGREGRRVQLSCADGIDGVVDAPRIPSVRLLNDAYTADGCAE
jgi:hypothetical protein